MTFNAKKTDSGIEIRNEDDLITTTNTWPPRNKQALEDLFDETDLSETQKHVFKILFGAADLDENTTDD